MNRILWTVGALAAVCTLSVSAQPRPAPKSGTTAPAPAPRREQPVPFRAGETLTYDIGWSSYVTAGTATVSVLEKKPSYGSTAYHIVAEGRPSALLSRLYTIYYKADTLLDAYSLLPQRGSVYSEEGRRRRTKTTLFNQRAKKAQYEVQTATLVKKDLALPSYSQDALSAIYVLRSIPMKPGETFNMPVCDDGKTYSVQVSVGGVETVKTPLGPLEALKVTPVVTGGGEPPLHGLAIWLTTDARRLPVRIEAPLPVGRFTLTLRQVAGA